MSYETEFEFEKELESEIKVDVELDWDIDFEKDVDIDVKVDSDVDVSDNLTHVTVDAEAFGDNSLVEVDLAVLTTDYLSSAAVSVTAAVD